MVLFTCKHAFMADSERWIQTQINFMVAVISNISHTVQLG